jgi:hypothetical protein
MNRVLCCGCRCGRTAHTGTGRMCEESSSPGRMDIGHAIHRHEKRTRAGPTNMVSRADFPNAVFALTVER